MHQRPRIDIAKSAFASMIRAPCVEALPPAPRASCPVLKQQHDKGWKCMSDGFHGPYAACVLAAHDDCGVVQGCGQAHLLLSWSTSSMWSRLSSSASLT